jgi:hypothetical protein
LGLNQTGSSKHGNIWSTTIILRHRIESEDRNSANGRVLGDDHARRVKNMFFDERIILFVDTSLLMDKIILDDLSFNPFMAV